MKQVLDYLEKQIENFERNGLSGADKDITHLASVQDAKLSAYKEIRKMINGSAPELHVCPDCMADVAYVKQPPGTFELVFVRHHS